MNKKMNIFEQLFEFDTIEQTILLLTRADFDDEMRDYINKHVIRESIDWDRFLGLVINHRVNGVVCRRIRKIDGIPSKIRRTMDYLLFAQKERNRCHKEQIKELFIALEENEIDYAFLKGAVLNSIYYGDSERISNDTDVLVNIRDLEKIIKLCTSMGYVQGDATTGEIVKATKKEILFAQLNTYETVPLVRETNNQYLPFHEFDVNFRLGNDDKGGLSNHLLQNTEIIGDKEFSLRTMSRENFLIYLCIHLYREAVMVFKIVRGDDLILYKFMDIHHYIMLNKEKILWGQMKEKADLLNKVQDVYYTLYYTEKLYPGTIDDSILNMFEIQDKKFLNQYRGRDNSSEIYDWKLNFYERMFHPLDRMSEASGNIGTESERYNNIREELQNIED